MILFCCFPPLFRYIEHKGINILQVARRDCTMAMLDGDKFQQFGMQITRYILLLQHHTHLRQGFKQIRFDEYI